MVDAEVLAAIARALDQDGGVELARAALRRADPLLRGPARRRLRAACADATLATDVRKDEPHTLRLAYLLLTRALPPPAARNDVDAVRAAFDAARAARPARPGFWWPTALAALTLLLAAAGAIRIARDDPSAGAPPSPSVSASTATAAPPVRGAFATGGVPAPMPGDAAVMGALRTDAPNFLIALDRRSDATRSGAEAGEIAAAEADMKDARAKALAPEVRDALGPEGARALEALLAAAETSAVREPLDDGLAQAVSALDDALAAQGLGFFVDGDVLTDTESGRRLVLLYTFRVARVSLFTSGSHTVRALHLRRLDKLNWSPTLLGFTRPTLRYAAVLLDQLDEQVLTLIAPALANDAPVPLFDPDAPAAERAAAEARAGELVRAEYGALPEIDALAAAKLGKLLGKRRALFAGWEKLAASRGMTLVVPAKLRLPEGFARSVVGLAPPDELTELAMIDAALDDRTREDAFAALREATAASVERHEVQHRLDALGKQPPPMPEVLEDRVGPAAQAGKERRHAATARAELSAYLAEIARDPRTPRVGLALVARFLFDRRLHGSPECYAALTILEGLAGKLGIVVKKPILVEGAIDRRAASEVFIALAALPPERLREGARTLWEALFQAPLPELHKLAPAAGDPPG